MPDDQDAWVAQGLDLELDEVLTTRTLPRQTPRPKGYAVRRLSGEDWAQSVARSVAENDRTDEHDPQSFGRFAQGQAQARRALSERDMGASFGAFADEVLVADLGIVRCGTTARYQSVGTDEKHRRRGRALHPASRDTAHFFRPNAADGPASRVVRLITSNAADELARTESTSGTITRTIIKELPNGYHCERSTQKPVPVDRKGQRRPHPD